MSDIIDEIQNTTHEYRKELERISRREGSATQADFQHPFRTSGEEKERIARMDADLTAAEIIAQNRALAARVEALESQPMIRTTAGAVSPSDSTNAKWLRALVAGDMAAMRSLGIGGANMDTTHAGVPTDMERRIIAKLEQASVVRQVANVMSIDSKRTLIVDGSLPTTSLVAEGGTITATDPTTTSVSVNPYKFVTAVTVSTEFVEDAIGRDGVGNAMNWVADRCALSMALSQEQYMTTGTGSSQPQGLGQISTTGVDVGAGGANNDFATDGTADMIITLAHAVAPQYRASNRCGYMFSDSMLAAIRKLKSGVNDYIWQASNSVGGLAQGSPGTIYGFPYWVNQYLGAANNITNAAVIGVFGNFEYFGVFDRTGVTVMVDPYSAASTGKQTLYLYTRWDSRILLQDAFAKMTV